MFTAAGIANFMAPASQLGILAVAAALLMIGGEFDLSIGSMVAFCRSDFCCGACRLAIAAWSGDHYHACLCGALVGTVNAQIVIRSGLPSFIVTLAFLFILRGLSLVGLKWATGGATQLRGVKEAVGNSALAGLFSGDAFQGLFAWMAERNLIAKFPNGEPTVKGVPVEVLWFVGVALIATYVLVRTRFGNWIFAAERRCAGGAKFRRSGAPRQDHTLHMHGHGRSAGRHSHRTRCRIDRCAARFQKEFEAIIAAVIGGCLLTGGYGSAIGAFFGAIIFGMVLIGLTYTQIDQDWYLVFLGGMLLIAVLFNNFIRKRATGER